MAKFDALKDEYAGLWASARIRLEYKSEVAAAARRIIQNRPRYDDVSRATGVPWFLIGIMHAMECGLDFKKHLHNGDPLARKTRLVPAGRPTTDGPWTWEESAADALTMPGKQFDRITDWSIERCCYVLELFNGFGYRAKGVPSAYLWSMTNQYTSGKYVADHVWSATAVSAQCGALAILKALIEIDPAAIDLHGRSETESVPNWGAAEPRPETPTSVVKTGSKSVTVKSLLAAMVAWVTQQVDSVFNILPQITGDVSEHVGAVESLGSLLKVNLAAITSVLVIVLIGVAIWRHTRDKHELENLRDGPP